MSETLSSILGQLQPSTPHPSPLPAWNAPLARLLSGAKRRAPRRAAKRRRSTRLQRLRQAWDDLKWRGRAVPTSQRKLSSDVGFRMAQVVLIRPGSTVYDEQDRIQGSLDIPLSERGWSEAERLAQELQDAGIKLCALYCGPGENACQTAEVIGKSLDLRPKPMDQFRNLNHGLWQGLRVDEVRRRNPKVFRQWIDAPLTVCPPMGETVEQTRERLLSAIRPLIRRHRNESFGLVVAEPCAQIVASFLRQDPEVHLEEHAITGQFEQIEVSPDLGRNAKL